MTKAPAPVTIRNDNPAVTRSRTIRSHSVNRLQRNQIAIRVTHQDTIRAMRMANAKMTGFSLRGSETSTDHF